MKKINTVLLFLFCFTFLTFVTNEELKAQEKNAALPQQLSLAKAIEIGLKNHPSIKATQADVRARQWQVEETRQQSLPVLYGSWDLRRNLIIPTTPVPAIAFDPNASPEAIRPLRFMTKWSSAVGINLQYDIFNPKNSLTLSEKTYEKNLSLQEAQIKKEELKFKIASDYAACLMAQKQLELAIEDTLSQQKILSITDSRYQNGKLTLPERNQIAETYHQSLGHFHQAQKILTNTRAQLLTDLGFFPKNESSLQLSDRLGSLLSDYVMESQNLHELNLRKLALEKNFTAEKRHLQKRGVLPVLSLQGFYGGNFFGNEFHYFDAPNWYGNSYLGLGLRLPITENISRAKTIKSLQAEGIRQEARYQEKEQELALEKFKTQEEVHYRQRQLLQEERIYQLSSASYQTAIAQFENGKITAIDLQQSHFAFQQAKTNYLQAMYDLILAKMSLKKM